MGVEDRRDLGTAPSGHVGEILMRLTRGMDDELQVGLPGEVRWSGGVTQGTIRRTLTREEVADIEDADSASISVFVHGEQGGWRDLAVNIFMGKVSVTARAGSESVVHGLLQTVQKRYDALPEHVVPRRAGSAPPDWAPPPPPSPGSVLTATERRNRDLLRVGAAGYAAAVAVVGVVAAATGPVGPIWMAAVVVGPVAAIATWAAVRLIPSTVVAQIAVGLGVFVLGAGTLWLAGG